MSRLTAELHSWLADLIPGFHFLVIIVQTGWKYHWCQWGLNPRFRKRWHVVHLYFIFKTREPVWVNELSATQSLNMRLYVFYREAGARLPPNAELPLYNCIQRQGWQMFNITRLNWGEKKRKKRRKWCHSPFPSPLLTLIYAKSFYYSPPTPLAGR